MAPSTRLNARSERRVDNLRELPSRRVGSSRNPLLIEDTPPPQTSAAAPAKPKNRSTTKLTRDKLGRFTKSKGAAKADPDRKKVVKKTTAPPKPKKEARPEKIECLICATIKTTKHSFKTSNNQDSCKHFANVCNMCVQRQIKTKMAARQLADAHLPCMFPSCAAVLDHSALKKVMATALFERWDAAVAKQLLASDPSFVSCLNPKCGIYFLAEGCGGRHQTSSGSEHQNSSSKTTSKPMSAPKPKAKQNDTAKAACPHCDHEICLSCNRPWHSGSCNSAKKHEDQQSENAIKKLGAKPCPKCGVNIEKQGGCDHMNCQRCRHDFCWECLGAFHSGVNAHLETCSHRRPMIAADIRNFVGDNMGIEQVNQAIARARRDMLAGRDPQPNVVLAPGVRLVNGEAVVQPHTPPRPDL